MKKILFSAYSLDVGGIETALITLLKQIHKDYQITLVLEKKEGIFLKEVPHDINIIEYKPNKNKSKIIRKICNFIKQCNFKIKYKNKFNFSACYATYSYPSAFVAREASKNSALWVHNDYMSFYNNNVKQYMDFFEKLNINQFKKIIFVSERDMKIFMENFKELKDKCIECNNLIDYEKIEKLAEVKIDDYKEIDNIVTFINLGRHDEKQKKLTTIINATKKLNEEGYIFRVVFIGDGPDNEKYRQLSKEIKNIEFLGKKENPYPYLKKSDCLLMSSDFEGYPVVFIESLILQKPIITTNVSDSEKDIKGKYGIVVEKTEEDIYLGMKSYLNNGYDMQKFDPKEFNDKIIKKINKIID